MVEGAGFEPAKAEPSDLQSDPFDRSGTLIIIAQSTDKIQKSSKSEAKQNTEIARRHKILKNIL